MLNNGNKTNCEFMDDIVSYIYDEIGAAERVKFEKHLAGCSVCSDEFAGISNARFSVFEWQKEEFAHISTPEIVIPYPAKTTADAETVSVGLLAGIREWMSLLVKFPAAVAAGLVLCIGLGFLITTYLGRDEQQIASNNIVSPLETNNTQVVAPSAVDKNEPEVAVKTEPPATARPSRGIQPVKAVEHRRPRNEKQLQARNSVNRNATQNISTAPVLSENYEEADDNSLRLSDLFADVDG